MSSVTLRDSLWKLFCQGSVLAFLPSCFGAHTGDTQEKNGLERQSGGVSSLYTGTSQRPLQVQPSNHLASQSMSAAAAAPSSSEQQGSTQQQPPAPSTTDPPKTEEQPAARSSHPPAQQHSRAAGETGQGRNGIQESREATGVPKSKSVEGFLNRFLLTTRPSASRDPIRRKAAVAASAQESHQLTQQISSLQMLPLTLPGNAALTAASGVAQPGEGQREPSSGQSPATVLLGGADRSTAGSDSGEDDLLPLEVQVSDTFVQNWNQHTSFHRRKQQREAQDEAADEHSDDSPASEAQPWESLLLDSSTDQRRDTLKKAGAAKQTPNGRLPVTAKPCNGGTGAAGHSSRSDKGKTGMSGHTMLVL